jgi:hypothetical protein
MLQLNRPLVDFPVHLGDKPIAGDELSKTVAPDKKETFMPFVEKVGTGMGNIQHAEDFAAYLEDGHADQGADGWAGSDLETGIGGTITAVLERFGLHCQPHNPLADGGVKVVGGAEPVTVIFLVHHRIPVHSHTIDQPLSLQEKNGAAFYVDILHQSPESPAEHGFHFRVADIQGAQGTQGGEGIQQADDTLVEIRKGSAG